MDVLNARVRGHGAIASAPTVDFEEGRRSLPALRRVWLEELIGVLETGGHFGGAEAAPAVHANAALPSRVRPLVQVRSGAAERAVSGAR